MTELLSKPVEAAKKLVASAIKSKSAAAQGVFVSTPGSSPTIYAVRGNKAESVFAIEAAELGAKAGEVKVNSYLSPDGLKIIYTIDDDAAGSQVVKVVTPGGRGKAKPRLIAAAERGVRYRQPIWCGDSNRVAYLKITKARRDRRATGEIWVASADGSTTPTKVYGNQATQVLAWSPDGKRIYFTRRNPHRVRGFIYAVLDVQDRETRDVALDLRVKDYPGQLVPLNFECWHSPDDTRLIFTLNDSIYLQNAHTTFIRVADPETGKPVNTLQIHSTVTNLLPSPDLSKIAFTVQNFVEIEGGTEPAGSGVCVASFGGIKNILPVQEDVPNNEPVAWVGDGSAVFVASSPRSVDMVKLDGSVEPIIRPEDFGVESAFDEAPSLVLEIPYVHQERNTAPEFNGGWACGPTSAVMLLAGYGLIDRRSDSYSPYGWYVSNQYTSKTGTTFSRTQADKSGRSAQGAYGTCTQEGEAWGEKVAAYISNHGLPARSIGASQGEAANQLKAGKPVIVGTTIFGYGHVLLLKGIMPDGRFVCNDPYWRKAGAGDDIYSWSQFGFCPFMVVVDRAIDAGGGSAPAPTTQAAAVSTSIEVGQGLDDSKRQRFNDAYNRNGSRENMGEPKSKPVQVNPPGNLRWVQDFGQQGFMIALDDRNDNPGAQPLPTLQPAFAVRNPILKKWREVYKGSGGQLGSLMSDEFVNLSGQHQNSFENGYITWDGSSPEANDAYFWPTSFNSWKAEYFNNPGLAGSPSYIRDESEINYDFGQGAPEGGKLGVLPNRFSVRWTRRVNFTEAGDYVFSVTADDGFRLFVDGANVADPNPEQYWIVSAPKTYEFTRTLAAGDHEIKLEYFEGSEGALVKFNWAKK